MSGIKVKGSATGAGNFTIEPPDGGASDRTLMLPDASGTLSLLDGPAFSARAPDGGGLGNGVFTIIQLQTEEFDTHGRFNNTGSMVNGIPAYSFMPDQPGYYWINGQVQASLEVPNLYVTIYKNGAEFKRGTGMAAQMRAGVVTALVYLNGTTDYVALYCYQTGSAVASGGLVYMTYFQGCLARVA